MNKIKMLLSKINARLIVYLIMLVFIVIILNCILGIFGLRFRSWVFLVAISIVIIGILIKVIQNFIKLPIDIKKIIGKILGILMLISIVFFRITALILFLILLSISSFFPTAEHIVTKNGVKCVAVVHSGFLNTDVDYYRYINFLVMGFEPFDTEYFNGAYDPIERELEKEKESKNTETNNVITKNPQNAIKQEIIKKEEIIEEKDIIYRQEINSTKSIRIVDRGNVLGQKKIIQIQKSTDNGKTWNNTLKTSDGAMTVNNEAKFSFINERVRFY